MPFEIRPEFAEHVGTNIESDERPGTGSAGACSGDAVRQPGARDEGRPARSTDSRKGETAPAVFLLREEKAGDGISASFPKTLLTGTEISVVFMEDGRGAVLQGSTYD